MSDSTEPHRPPKYVDGEYEPLFADPTVDFLLMFGMGDPHRDIYVGTTDDSGDAEGVVRDPDGTPMFWGGYFAIGHVRDGEVSIDEQYRDEVDISDVEEAISDAKSRLNN